MQTNYNFSSLTGKKVLALVRGGDFCHPGETESIDLVFAGMSQDPKRLLLDVGCGAGGVAKYVQEHGLGRVVGVDIDAESIEYARGLCPQAEFHVADVAQADALLPLEHFDCIYLFSSFFAFPDQLAALKSLHKVAKKGAELLLFDYVDLRNAATKKTKTDVDFFESYRYSPTVAHVAELCAASGWRNLTHQDLSAQFAEWYRELIRRLPAHKDEIIAKFSAVWYEKALLNYRDGYLKAIDAGILGGAVFRAWK